MKNRIVSIFIYFLFFVLKANPCSAVMSDYPPFEDMKNRPPSPLFQELPNEFKGGDFYVKTYKKYPWSVLPYGTDIYYKNKLIWGSESEEERRGITGTSYVGTADLDGDGIKDIVVITANLGNTLNVYVTAITIVLKKENAFAGFFQLETMTHNDVQSFVDFNGDGKFEILKCDLVQDAPAGIDGRRHNYWVYNIYEFQGNKLVMKNSLGKGFPKFIWYTEKPNNKPTHQISTAVQKQYVLNKLPQTIIAQIYD